jgi:hypothetical protein
MNRERRWFGAIPVGVEAENNDENSDENSDENNQEQ